MPQCLCGANELVEAHAALKQFDRIISKENKRRSKCTACSTALHPIHRIGGQCRRDFQIPRLLAKIVSDGRLTDRLEAADKALYNAKEAGRNRIMAA